MARIFSRSPAAYELHMRLLYGRHYRDRIRAVAAEVPPGASVVELCCGPGTLYTDHLRERVSSYIGLDHNERFVHGLRRQGIDARPVDLSNARAPIPSADVAIIQDALENFLPDAAHVIDRMLAAARRLVVVSERVRHLATSPNPLVRLVGLALADPGPDERDCFTEETLDELFVPYRELVLKGSLIAGGREKLYVLRAD